MTDESVGCDFERQVARLRGTYWIAILGGLIVLACGGNANEDEADSGQDSSGGSSSESGGATGLETGGTDAPGGGGSGGAQTGAGGGEDSSGGGADASGGTASANAGGSGGESTTGRRHLGQIAAGVKLSEGLSSTLGPYFSWELEVENPGEPSRMCPSTKVGDCSMTDCRNVAESPDPGTAVRLHAGKIVFTVDNGMVFETVPEAADNAYSVISGEEFAGGEQISFAAEGGTIEAFNGEIQLPLAPMILSPTFTGGATPVARVNVDATQDLELTWDVRGSSQWILFTTTTGSADDPDFDCVMDASAGSGVIPAEVLQHVGAGTEFEGAGMNYEEIELESGFVTALGRFDLVNEAKNATPVFVVQ